MLSKRIISAAIILASVTLLSGGTAFGNQIAFLDLTENSSSSLTATLTGPTGVTVTVTNTSADQWALTFAGIGGAETVTGSGIWTEPDPGSTAGNSVAFGGVMGELIVRSDLPNETGLPNGATDLTGFLLQGGQLQVTFNDDGDGTSSVPDATATLPLLSLSLAGVGIFAKRKKV